MQVATGKSVLNGIAIGKIKIYRAPKLEISDALTDNPDLEVQRFEEAREKAIEQQNALYEKAKVTAGEESAEIFSVHAMMLEDDDLIDATTEIIPSQKHKAEYAVEEAFHEQIGTDIAGNGLLVGLIPVISSVATPVVFQVIDAP